MHFSTDNLINTLNIGWQGMLTIFIGMALIFLVILLLTNPLKKK